MKLQPLFDTLQFIKDNPDKWDQTDWGAGREKHCFGGWALIRAGIDLEMERRPLERAMRDIFNLSVNDVDFLVASVRTLPEIEAKLNELRSIELQSQQNQPVMNKISGGDTPAKSFLYYYEIFISRGISPDKAIELSDKAIG